MSTALKFITSVCPGPAARPRSVKRPAAGWLAALLLLPLTGFGPQAWAAADPDSVSFTLEGCRNDGTITLPNGSGNFVCPDAAYTTGNLGKSWNELDLVPFRITAQAKNAAPASQTYAVSIALDNEDAGNPGHDVLAADNPSGAPVLNTALSDASCSALSATAQLTKIPGVGGTDQTIYRILTITQPKNTTCVYDWYGRLALGSHNYPGSSLHANLLNQNLTTAGIGAADVSIPVKEILPQELDKTMGATQDSTHTWSLSKGPSEKTVSFGDVCATDQDFEEPVTIKVTWEKLAATPSGEISVVTKVYATNPAYRTITVDVSDQIYSGESALGAPDDSGPVDVPANTQDYLVLTHQTTVPADSADLNDIATATYTDKVTGVEVPGQTTATASASVTAGTTLNGTAIITDSESITGDGLTFLVDAPLVGDFTNYVAGTETTGPVVWSSGEQSDSGFVEFYKTVYLDEKRIAEGALKDTATLKGTDGFRPITASLEYGITSSATVKLKVEKSIPAGILNAGDKMEIAFEVTRAHDSSYKMPVDFQFVGGEATSLSDTVSPSLTSLRIIPT